MPRKFRVNLEGYASASVIVELEDDEVAEVEAEIVEAHREDGVDDAAGIARDVTERLLEIVNERVYEQGVPSLCAQCAGWGGRDSLSVGDEWEPGKVWDNDLGRERDARLDEYIEEVRD